MELWITMEKHGIRPKSVKHWFTMQKLLWFKPETMELLYYHKYGILIYDEKKAIVLYRELWYLPKTIELLFDMEKNPMVLHQN